MDAVSRSQTPALSIRSGSSSGRDTQSVLAAVLEGRLDVSDNVIPQAAMLRITELAPRYLQLRQDEVKLRGTSKELQGVRGQLVLVQADLSAAEKDHAAIEARLESERRARSRAILGRGKISASIEDLESRLASLDLSISSLRRQLAALELERHRLTQVSKELVRTQQEMDEMFEELFEDFRSDFPIEEALFTKVSDLSEQLHRVKERLNESTNMHTVVEDMRKAVEKILADLRNGRLLLPLLKDTIVDATRPFDSLQSLRPDLPNPFEAHDAVDDVMTDRRLEPNEDDVAAMLGELASLSDYLSWETTEYRDEMHMIERELGRVKSQLDRERHRVVSIAVALRQRQLRQQQAASHHMSHLSLSSHSSHQFAAGQAPYQPSPSPSPSQMMSPASPTTSLSPSVSAALNAAMAMSASRASMSDVGSSGYSAYGAAAPWGYVGSTGGTLTRRGSIQSEAQWSEASRRESRMSTRPVQTDMLARSPPGMPHGFTHASGRALAQSHSAAAAAAARELPAWASSAAASARAEQQQQQPGSRSSFMSRKMSSRR